VGRGRLYGESPAQATPRRREVRLCPSFGHLVALRAGTEAMVAVDIPMGLLDSVDFRPCDVEARELLVHRVDTVFAPPSRRLLKRPATRPPASSLPSYARTGRRPRA
jgi:predicted RNase H-like nuclease